MSDYWAVVQCEARREAFVRMLLGLSDFETFAPLIRVRHAMVRYRTAMLFPSYVFVKVQDNFWYDILWTPRSHPRDHVGRAARADADRRGRDAAAQSS